jgi:hypothetical protein
MSRVPLTTSESGKNASGEEAFGSKLPETLVVESPAALAADMTSVAAGAGTTAASEADKAGTSAPPTTGGEAGDRGTSSPQEAPGPQGIIDEGMEAVNDEDGAFMSAPSVRQRSLLTAATWRRSGRRRARSGLCCW